MGIHIPYFIRAYSKHQIWSRTIFSNSNFENSALVVVEFDDFYLGNDCVNENI